MNIGLFKNNEITDSVEGAVNTRMNTPIYGVFILSWAACHWEAIYTAFFVDQSFIYEKYRMLRSEYIQMYFLDPTTVKFYIGWLVPILVTVLIIWVFPGLFGLRAFRADEKYKNDKKKIALEEATKIEVAETKLEQKSVDRIEATTQKVVKEKALTDIDPTALWPDEYNRFRSSKLYNDFQKIIDSVYDHGGQVKDDYNDFMNRYDFEIPQSILVYSDTNELVTLQTNTTNPRIKLTDKGRYFVSQYTADKAS